MLHSEGPFGSRIRQLRIARGLSQRSAAERLGISSGYMSQLEADLYRPSYDIIRKIASFYYVPIEELLSLAGYEIDEVQLKEAQGRFYSYPQDVDLDYMIETLRYISDDKLSSHNKKMLEDFLLVMREKQKMESSLEHHGERDTLYTYKRSPSNIIERGINLILSSLPEEGRKMAEVTIKALVEGLKEEKGGGLLSQS